MKLFSSPFGRLTLAILSALVCWLAWPSAGVAPLLFLAFVPLLIIEEESYLSYQQGKKLRIGGYIYISFLLFNLSTTWWIWFASDVGMIFAMLANALLMTIAFQLFHRIKLSAGRTTGNIFLITVWMGYEYLHLNWDLAWPWLNLGNGFASSTDMVQWYEYTGVAGGTLWILSANILIFEAIRQGFTRQKVYIILSVLIIPVLCSYLIKYSYRELSYPVEAIAVQPNIDPYNEKFGGLSSEQQLNKMLVLAKPLVNNNTALIVCPETALPDNIWVNELNAHPNVEAIRTFIKPFPHVSFLTGVTLGRLYHSKSEKSVTARKFTDTDNYYDVYNAAIQLNKAEMIPMHFKSRLVPGVEKMPFPEALGFLEKYSIDLGGTTGSLGTQERPSVFHSGKICVAPVICYESVFGEYVSEYIQQGANLICIMTNDGWWKDTPGHRQHCQYARLRAIEERRSIVRAANTGISCFINQLGEISQATQWWTPAAINQNVNLNNYITFYGRHGDYLYKMAAGLILPILLFSFFNKKAGR